MVVSIVCNVYNHAPFLRQCLEGLIMQKTDFPFEILIHDDASTDGSDAIIRDYETNYPDLIFPIYQTKNQYSQGIPIEASFQYPRAKGKYIALCEGDDYWTDPLKLQKQVDFLECHPGYSMSFGNAMTHWEGSARPDELFSHIEDRDYDPVEFSKGWICATATAIFRREVIDTFLFKRYTTDPKIITGDLPLWITCSTIGKIRGFSDVFTVYRRVQSGFMLSMHAAQRINMGDFRVEIFRVFGDKYKTSCLHMALVHYRLARNYAQKEKNPRDYFKALFRAIGICFRYPLTTLKRIPIILKQRKERLAQ